MSVDLELAEGVVADIEAQLDAAEAMMTQCETALTTLELVAQSFAGNGQALEASLGPLFDDIKPSIEALVMLPAPIVAALDAVEADLRATPTKVSDELDKLDAALERLLDSVADETNNLKEAIEAAVEAMKGDITERINALNGELAELLDGFDEGRQSVENVIEEVVDGFDRVRHVSLGAALELVDRIDSSLGKVAESLHQIEDVVEPVMPVIAMLESVS